MFDYQRVLTNIPSMGRMTHHWWTVAFWASSIRMNAPRPLALGAAGWSLGTTVLGLLSQIIFQDRLPDPVCFCPELTPISEITLPELDYQHWIFFAIGIFTGLCFGVLLHICFVVRERWRRFVLAQLIEHSSSSSGTPRERHFCWLAFTQERSCSRSFGQAFDFPLLDRWLKKKKKKRLLKWLQPEKR